MTLLFVLRCNGRFAPFFNDQRWLRGLPLSDNRVARKGPSAAAKQCSVFLREVVFRTRYLNTQNTLYLYAPNAGGLLYG